MELLKPTNDYVFKKIFGKSGNEDILIDLLESIMNVKIKQIEIQKDATLERTIEDNKLGILDIKATLNNNTIVDLEMQVSNNHNVIERALFYLSGMYHDSLMKSEDYRNSNKTVVIFIMDFDYFNEGPFHEIAYMKREYENIILTDKFEIHLIQLPKFKKKCTRISKAVEEWLTFINVKRIGEMNMPDFKNKMVQKAMKELETLSGDEEQRRLAELRDKAIRDENDGRTYEREQGKIEGKLEGKTEIVKNMLKNKLDIELICKVTGFTKQEIEQIKNK